MKKTILSATLLLLGCGVLSGQIADPALDDPVLSAATAISAAPQLQAPPVKPKLWELTLRTALNFGQTGFFNWAAGGNNSINLEAFIDGGANYKSLDEKMYWKNRLQLEYGIMYISDKPIIQKTNDRIYLESRWGHVFAKDWYYTVDFDLKTQFSKGFEYKTPTTGTSPEDWKNAAQLKSNCMSPGYINLGIGVDWIPKNWFSLNMSPLTGGVVLVLEEDDAIRKSYGMDPLTDETGKVYGYSNYRLELGAQIKADVKLQVNGKLDFTSQLVIFSDYLSYSRQSYIPRINWDNRLTWRIWKFLAFNITTYMIYDDLVRFNISDTNPEGDKKVQLKESVTIGFIYLLDNKKG